MVVIGTLKGLYEVIEGNEPVIDLTTTLMVLMSLVKLFKRLG